MVEPVLGLNLTVALNPYTANGINEIVRSNLAHFKGCQLALVLLHRLLGGEPFQDLSANLHIVATSKVRAGV